MERFDLFLAFSEPRAIKNAIAVPRGDFGQLAGLVLIVLGMAMIAVAGVRFARNAREIDDKKKFPGTGSRVDLALGLLIVLLTAALLFYLFHALTAQA